MKDRVKVAQSDLDKAQAAYQTQANLLSEQAKSIYRNGSFATVDVILGSKNVSDFITRVKFLNAVGMHQADVLASLRGQRDLIERQLNDLAAAQKEAEQLEFEMRARKIEIMLRIQDRQAMMASAESDLQVLLQQEAARRNVEQQELLYSIVSGTNKLGITVVAGAPVETALAYHGVPYVWGGETPAGFDCSGLVKYVFAQHGVELPHYALSQFMMGDKVAVADLQPGDCVFFGSPVHHVGIYIGGGYFIHAPRTGDYVKISRLSDRYDFAGARRYSWVNRAGAPLEAAKTTDQALSAGWR
jgi:cell wall-associated NlpC family hydrolase